GARREHRGFLAPAPVPGIVERVTARARKPRPIRRPLRRERLTDIVLPACCDCPVAVVPNTQSTPPKGLFPQVGADSTEVYEHCVALRRHIGARRHRWLRRASPGAWGTRRRRSG